MAVREGARRSTTGYVERIQPENGAKDVVHKVVVASAQILVDFEKQMRGLRKVNVFLSEYIADDGQPSIQLVGNAWLHDASFRDNCDSSPCRGVSVVLPLWVSGNGPPFGRV